jgi:hypothetical protein
MDCFLEMLARPEGARTMLLATNDERESQLATEHIHLG